MSCNLNPALGACALKCHALVGVPPNGPLSYPSSVHWPQSLPLVPPLLPPDFPSWPVSPAGPMPSPGPSPWHSAQVGTCSWNPATLPLCSSRERGWSQAGRPQGKAWEWGLGLGAPPPTTRRGRSPPLPCPEELATREQRHGEAGTPFPTFRAAPGPLSPDIQLGTGGLAKSVEDLGGGLG